MRECIHRAGTRKISLKNGASTPTFSLSIGKSRGQVSLLKLTSDSISPLAFKSCCVSLQRKKCRQQIIGLNDESFSIAVRIDAKKKPVLGEMLGDAVGPAFCM